MVQCTLQVAHRHQIIGQPDYAWAGALQNVWAGPNFAVEEPDIAASPHGITTIDIHYEANTAFEAALDEIHYNTTTGIRFHVRPTTPFWQLRMAQKQPQFTHQQAFDAVGGARSHGL
ncbi:expressed unknown protein [Seminavis robusta]|uniref:Uncharacterized protein n=1 Tax=Seminavis robusta TaxID=568900 RepID=A0A9N8EQ42_9STRA|nr:expressed unknown protein [Seminavis robusta]|eukprot:Sro1752_g295330.1 n/a (117) ;mRNA; f:5821-6171